MTENKKAPSAHKLMMDFREKLSSGGILEVLNYDEQAIVAETEMGVLTIKGANLNLSHWNRESGTLGVDGHINSLTYSDGAAAKTFFGKIFR